MEINSLEAAILMILDTHRGREQSIPRADLVKEVNQACLLFPVNERTIRQTIKHLVERHGAWIGSSSRGYFLIETTEELERACRYYHGYAMSLLHVEAKLRKVSLPDLIGQLSLKISSG